MIRAILFDVFGTLLDMGPLKATEQGRAELRAYGHHLRRFRETGVYQDLKLPESWKSLPKFPDVDAGWRRLASKFSLFTFSNGPVDLTNAAMDRGIEPGQGYVMGYIDVRFARAFKPTPWLYPWASGLLRLPPELCMMVSANRDFGDLEGAKACGMAAQLIRGASDVPDLLALAEKLGC